MHGSMCSAPRPQRDAEDRSRARRDTSSPPIRCTTSSRRGRCAAAPSRRPPRRRTARRGSARRPRAVRPWLTGLSSENSSAARSPSPSRANASTVHKRGVRVLPAVLAHAGQVALDVAGAAAPSCRTAASSSSTMPSSRRTRRASTAAIAWRARAGIAGAGDHRPRLRDRVDLALGVLLRPERRAVVEVRAPIPVAVPRCSRRPRSAVRGVPPIARRACGSRRARSARSANGRRIETRNQPSQTLSPLPPAPTRFMPSFQSPVPISGRPCAPVVEADRRSRGRSARTATPVSDETDGCS